MSRFIQAFGASTGSVVTQTILRESIAGNKRHAVFAQISAALAFTPAFGPLLGGWVDQSLGFRAVFFTLIVTSVSNFIYTLVSLPETRVATPTNINTLSVARRLATDSREYGRLVFSSERLMGYCLITTPKLHLFSSNFSKWDLVCMVFWGFSWRFRTSSDSCLSHRCRGFHRLGS